MPIAATALPGSDLEGKGVTQLNDLQYAAPSLSIGNAGLANAVNIRGVGRASGSPAVANRVAVYVDGLFQTPTIYANQFYDIADVEILRGPQGTLVGKRFHRWRNLHQQSQSEAGRGGRLCRSGWARHQAWSAQGAVNLPVSDALALRLAGEFTQHESYYALLAIPPLAYVVSVYSGAVPIFLPTLWPHSYYNARYGTSAIPLLALGAAALVALAPRKGQAGIAIVIVLAGAGWWAFHWRPNQWVAWEESRVNSEPAGVDERSGRIHRTALRARNGDLTSSYPLTGVLREAGIPLREALDVDNGLFWDAEVGRPDLYPKPEWVIAQGGDGAQTAVNRAGRSGITYRLEKQIIVKGQPVIEIYRR